MRFMMKNINNSFCPICGKKIIPIRIVKLSTIFHQKVADILQCPECDIAWTFPNPSIDGHYETNYEYVHQILKSEDGYRAFALPMVDLIEKLDKPSSKFLDIGCGLGYLVEYASKKGFDSEGIDLNVHAVENAKQRGLHVSNKTIDELIESKSKYDIISMSHVLEHISYPIYTLKQIRELVNIDGYLILSQTNYKGVFPRLFPQLWYGWQPHEHFWHFTPKTLSYMLQISDFEIHEIIQVSLHHAFRFSINPKTLIGQNIISAIAHSCNKIGTKEALIIIAKAVKKNYRLPNLKEVK